MITNNTLIFHRSDLARSQNPYFREPIKTHFKMPQDIGGQIVFDFNRGTAIAGQTYADEMHRIAKPIIGQRLVKEMIEPYGLYNHAKLVGQKIDHNIANAMATRVLFNNHFGLKEDTEKSKAIYKAIYYAYRQELMHLVQSPIKETFIQIGAKYPKFLNFLGFKRLNTEDHSEKLGNFIRDKDQVYFESETDFAEFELFDGAGNRYKTLDAKAKALYKLDINAMQFQLQTLSISGPDKNVLAFCYLNNIAEPAAERTLLEYFESNDPEKLLDAENDILILNEKIGVPFWKAKLFSAVMIAAVIAAPLSLYGNYLSNFGLVPGIGIIAGASLFFASTVFWLDIAKSFVKCFVNLCAAKVPVKDIDPLAARVIPQPDDALALTDVVVVDASSESKTAAENQALPNQILNPLHLATGTGLSHNTGSSRRANNPFTHGSAGSAVAGSDALVLNARNPLFGRRAPEGPAP